MVERFTVSRDDNIYEAFPDVAITPSGRLVCVFSECTHHGDRRYTCVMVATSDDRGRTWSTKRRLSEPTRRVEGEPNFVYCDCPRIAALSDGRLCAIADRHERHAEGN
jgi:sialidase-1